MVSERRRERTKLKKIKKKEEKNRHSRLFALKIVLA
jgi:hypothetical protein